MNTKQTEAINNLKKQIEANESINEFQEKMENMDKKQTEAINNLTQQMEAIQGLLNNFIKNSNIS